MNQIPFVDLKTQYLRIKESIDSGIHSVLEHGRFIMGPEVAESERRLAEFAGAKHCVTVSSGTDAMTVPLMALGVGPGDMVFLPAFTFTASAEVVALLGATPVFVDVDQRTFNIDPADLEKRIAWAKAENRGKPRAVIAVDLFGLPADYDSLAAICRREGMTLIADAAQSFGATYKTRRVGTLADITCTSFFPAKPLGVYGDGGAVFCNDDALAKLLDSIRLHGRGAHKYDTDRVGLNARFDTLQAAILLAKLDIFEDEIAQRQQAAQQYTDRLHNTVTTPVLPEDSSSVWAQYTIQSPNRDVIADALKKNGIPSAIYYPRPMNLQTAYRKYGQAEGSCPTAEALCANVLSLPMHPYLEENTIATITRVIQATA